MNTKASPSLAATEIQRWRGVVNWLWHPSLPPPSGACPAAEGRRVLHGSDGFEITEWADTHWSDTDYMARID